MEPIHFFYPQMACKIHESTTSVTLLSIRGKFRLSLTSFLPIRGFPSKTIPLIPRSGFHKCHFSSTNRHFEVYTYLLGTQLVMH